MITTYDSPRLRQASRNAVLRPYTSSAATRKNRIPGETSFLACAITSSGFVATASSPGMPASWRRCGSFARASGIYRPDQARAWSGTVTRAQNTQVTQFSTRPVTPQCCGAAHAVVILSPHRVSPM